MIHYYMLHILYYFCTLPSSLCLNYLYIESCCDMFSFLLCDIILVCTNFLLRGIRSYCMLLYGMCDVVILVSCHLCCYIFF